MKTTTTITKGIKMTDASYKIELELGYVETSLFVTALNAQLATYRKLVEENTVAMSQSPEVFAAIESIIASLKTGIAAFDIQSAIEHRVLGTGNPLVQS